MITSTIMDGLILIVVVVAGLTGHIAVRRVGLAWLKKRSSEAYRRYVHRPPVSSPDPCTQRLMRIPGAAFVIIPAIEELVFRGVPLAVYLLNPTVLLALAAPIWIALNSWWICQHDYQATTSTRGSVTLHRCLLSG